MPTTPTRRISVAGTVLAASAALSAGLVGYAVVQHETAGATTTAAGSTTSGSGSTTSTTSSGSDTSSASTTSSGSVSSSAQAPVASSSAS